MIERVGEAASALKCIRVFVAQDLVLQVYYLLILTGSFRMPALAVEGESNVIPGPKRIGMFGAKHFLADGENLSMLGFGFSRFPAVIEGNGEAVPSQQSIGMHGTEESFLESYHGAEPCNRVVIFALAILGIGNADPAAEGIGMIGAERALPGIVSGAQHFLGFAIRTLFHQQVADGVLDVGPLSCVGLA